jgi:hypothetical protein
MAKDLAAFEKMAQKVGRGKEGWFGHEKLGINGTLATMHENLDNLRAVVYDVRRVPHKHKMDTRMDIIALLTLGFPNTKIAIFAGKHQESRGRPAFHEQLEAKQRTYHNLKSQLSPNPSKDKEDKQKNRKDADTTMGSVIASTSGDHSFTEFDEHAA